MADGSGFTMESRPIVDIAAGEIDVTATVAEMALRKSGLPVFQRGAALVTPISYDVPAAHGRMTKAAGLKELTTPAIIDLMSQSATYRHWNAHKGAMVRCNPPEQVARVILSRSGQWQAHSIAGVITTPTLRPDGTLLIAPGYDATTRLYHVEDDALQLPEMPPRASRAHAEQGVELLDTLLDEFPFVEDVDRSVALSALITPVCRGIIPLAPLHALKASTAGTGKSFLVDLAAAISTGRPCPVLSASERGEELEKRLAGVLLAAYPIVSLDNVNGEIGGDLLCQSIERPVVRLRELGGSKIYEVECRATFFATGNGLRVRGDMVRRTVLCRLDANVERPELREFRDDPLKRVLDDRGTYVAAALNIVRAYLSAGQPGRIRPQLASFPTWSDTVRSALVWLGRIDPIATMEAARDTDPELAELRQVLAEWWRQFQDGRVTVRSAVENPCDELRDALTPIAGERGTFNTRRLGNWLSAREGRIASVFLGSETLKLRFTRAGTVGGVAIWQVKRG